MREEDYKHITFKSNAEYKNISSIIFNPIKETTSVKICSKGDKKIWRLLGLIPIFQYKEKHTLYYVDGDMMTEEDVNNSRYEFLKDDKIYEKAEVIIQYTGKTSSKYYYFSSNKEAMDYVETIKQNCLKVGNPLN